MLAVQRQVKANLSSSKPDQWGTLTSARLPFDHDWAAEQ